MTHADLAIVAALVFAWGAFSARLERFDFTAPIVFVLAGRAPDPRSAGGAGRFVPDKKVVKELAELTLVLVLFTDASRVRWHDLKPTSVCTSGCSAWVCR